MIDGPFRSNRWIERFQSFEALIHLLAGIGMLILLGTSAYELFIVGAYLKLAVAIFVGVPLFALASMSSSVLGLIPLLAFVFAWGLWN